MHLSLWLVALWRLPLWLFLFVVITWNVSSGAAVQGLGPVYPIALSALVFLAAMDVYWSIELAGLLRPVRDSSSP